MLLRDVVEWLSDFNFLKGCLHERSGWIILGILSSYRLHIPPKVLLNMGTPQTVTVGFSDCGQSVYIHEFFSGGASTQRSFDVYFFIGEETGSEFTIRRKP